MKHIRKAGPDDLDLIYDLSLEALGRSTYKDIPHDEFHAKKIFGGLILNQFAWVTESGNGLLLGKISPIWFNPKVMVASDVIFYVRSGEKMRAGVNLLKKFIEWGKDNADEVAMSISFGHNIDKTEQFYEHFGFKRIGGDYLLRGNDHVKSS